MKQDNNTAFLTDDQNSLKVEGTSGKVFRLSRVFSLDGTDFLLRPSLGFSIQSSADVSNRSIVYLKQRSLASYIRTDAFNTVTVDIDDIVLPIEEDIEILFEDISGNTDAFKVGVSYEIY